MNRPDEETHLTVEPDMNAALRDELLAMKTEDLRVRAELDAAGLLENGYHSRMEAVHRRNAARLREIIAAHGWTGTRLVGEEGADAAWLIVQHAIGEPDFQRFCLRLLQTATVDGDVPPWQAAYLEDRIRMFEGRPQRYGTQFDIGDDGLPTPYEIEDPDHVDDRRRAVGLEPLADRLSRVERVTPPDPATRARREREYQEWLHRVGWRP